MPSGLVLELASGFVGIAPPLHQRVSAQPLACGSAPNVTLPELKINNDSNGIRPFRWGYGFDADAHA